MVVRKRWNVVEHIRMKVLRRKYFRGTYVCLADCLKDQEKRRLDAEHRLMAAEALSMIRRA